MRKKASQRTDSNDKLEKIGRAFAAYRQSHGKGPIRYPSHLKNQATSAVSSECHAALVARTAGVSEQALSYWLKQAAKCPQELKVVAQGAAPALPSTVLSQAPMARLQMRSGVIIEIPVQALSSDLIDLLNTEFAS